MFVRSRCNDCVLVHLLGGGFLFIDEASRLAVSSPARTEWKPQLGSHLLDGVFHVIGHSIGPGGEALFVDGVEIAKDDASGKDIYTGFGQEGKGRRKTKSVAWSRLKAEPIQHVPTQIFRDAAVSRRRLYMGTTR